MTSTTKTDIPQLLKWVGNKHRFAKEIVSYMPDQINTYYEPFLGSGSVLATLCYSNNHSNSPRFQSAVGSDALPFLMGIFNYVKNDPRSLSNHYRECIENYNENRTENYLAIRDRFNTNFDPLDFAVLSRTCYSGIIRFRKSDGFMSTPIGPHNPISPEKFEERIDIWHNLFQNNVDFYNQDFRVTMDMAQEGDLIYCDPPYTHSQSILYGAQSFKIQDLWGKIAECKARNVHVMLSINATKKSGNEDVSVTPPDGLFERAAYINCGISMINRLQRAGTFMEEENVSDALFLTW